MLLSLSIRPFIIISSFIITRAHGDFFVNNAAFHLLLNCKRSKLLFSGFFEKRIFKKLFLQHLKENTLKENSLTHHFITISQYYKCFAYDFTIHQVISSLSSAFREFISDVFPLHIHAHTHTHTLTHIYTHKHTHTHTHICLALKSTLTEAVVWRNPLKRQQ